MRPLLIKKKKEEFDPKKNQQSQNIGNRDIPLGGPTSVTDTTSYGRPGKGANNPPKNNIGKAQETFQLEKQAKEKQAKEEFKKTNLERKSDSSGRQ